VAVVAAKISVNHKTRNFCKLPHLSLLTHRFSEIFQSLQKLSGLQYQEKTMAIYVSGHFKTLTISDHVIKSVKLHL
jgi:hypothetical protein